MEHNLNCEFKGSKESRGYYPIHDYVKNWLFKDEEFEERAQTEANLADAIARVASINCLSTNDVMHIFPFVLRMLKSQSRWAE